PAGPAHPPPAGQLGDGHPPVVEAGLAVAGGGGVGGEGGLGGGGGGRGGGGDGHVVGVGGDPARLHGHDHVGLLALQELVDAGGQGVPVGLLDLAVDEVAEGDPLDPDLRGLQ